MTSRLVETWVRPPAEVTTRMSLSTSSGRRSVSLRATKPPIEMPISAARWILSASDTPATSPARSAMLYGPVAESLSPTSR
jgi:hypothetical protein